MGGSTMHAERMGEADIMEAMTHSNREWDVYQTMHHARYRIQGGRACSTFMVAVDGPVN